MFSQAESMTLIPMRKIKVLFHKIFINLNGLFFSVWRFVPTNVAPTVYNIPFIKVWYVFFFFCFIFIKHLSLPWQEPCHLLLLQHTQRVPYYLLASNTLFFFGNNYIPHLFLQEGFRCLCNLHDIDQAQADTW